MICWWCCCLIDFTAVGLKPSSHAWFANSNSYWEANTTWCYCSCCCRGTRKMNSWTTNFLTSVFLLLEHFSLLKFMKWLLNSVLSKQVNKCIHSISGILECKISGTFCVSVYQNNSGPFCVSVPISDLFECIYFSNLVGMHAYLLT